MVMLHQIAQMSLPDAVNEVLAAPSDDAFALLDRLIRSHLLALLRDGNGEIAAISDAVFRAYRSAPPLYVDRWEWALELLRDATETPGLAQQLQILGSRERAAEVIRAIGIGDPRPRKDVLEQVKIKEQHLTGLLRDLEDARLVERARAGREKWLTLTGRGRAVYRLLMATDKQETPTSEESVYRLEERSWLPSSNDKRDTLTSVRALYGRSSAENAYVN